MLFLNPLLGMSVGAGAGAIFGKLNKQIAYELEIAEETVKIHRGRMMRKMKVESVAELVRLTEMVGIKPAEVARQ